MPRGQHVINQLSAPGSARPLCAAVSHELRTPLTRMALRAESLGSEVERRRFGKDIREMDLMIRATLDHLCGAADVEATVALDLGSLVESLVADRQDCGERVSLCMPMHPQAPAPHVKAQVSALRRAIGNLIDNAVSYGGAAEVGVVNAHVCVIVSNSGPSIGRAGQVLQPPCGWVRAPQHQWSGWACRRQRHRAAMAAMWC
jgi:protein-histidine pros-kinase